MINPTLHVRIISPQSLLLDTQAESISSRNLQGNFDILPQHANFLTVVEKQPIIVRVKNQKPLRFDLPLAIIFATENKVNIYTYALPQNVEDRH
ncbi:hypothetical protein A3C26_03475 [Candidatus Daviesbacteria bacterium RIFCSPHIGHO2_02_FULL_39_12]|uniref:ATP synthase F1 complex delta/epsilon subunit N-terminal domain-containing protein n=2 Tax=Candidatus Daviesiibacteriota TaxID=1752718 RepID=A0A1F5JAB4_9BACT|nr:MAG: hypothetical protein A3C26_03475 [Candidatus Daviesbacteria bacterium RIFCSPHIGHO2_02_FULL_39_12]OGE72804.1 MAG: hypothetical protein A3H40_01925 [Candidatus Daviesbacteria bacterium RIFCSPLOWO2_02_FULL_38_15]